MNMKSRPSWACELKFNGAGVKYVALCHAPRGRVS